MAPLWPLHGVNLGTLLRTCGAVGACMAVPRLPWVPEALARGNTLRRPSCVQITVTLNRRTYSPVLRQASLPETITVPWWQGRTLDRKSVV